MGSVTKDNKAKNEYPHHNVWDDKHRTTRVYFYIKEYKNEKAASQACHDHRKSVTQEVYRDWDKNGYYYFL